MSDNARLTTHKLFLLPDYEKEGEYLTKMHGAGWKLERVAGFSQHFVKCEPENVVYKLDYAKNNANYPEYIRMFSDYGWEHCGRVMGFDYFRRNADGLSEEELEIFSDPQSKLNMMKRVILTRMTPLLIIFFMIIIPNIYLFAVNSMRFHNPAFTVMSVTYLFLFVLYISIFIYCIRGFRKLKKKYTE
ncbi:DUF2812 domain-containing protein [uncultured Ruminococcus sp.]|uniref:DUF2812 domain-containing protein n=1 Tax=uncultured Ruminococcus sp. TaxID=165186 RepID=UPI00261B7551|nr:DUF2812 domain-containing protein [uncultured Ruminococcus sp.]